MTLLIAATDPAMNGICGMQDRMFDSLDEDGDGEITSSELMSTFRMLGCPATHEEVEQLIAQVDPDRSGSLNRPEPPILADPTPFRTLTSSQLLCSLQDHRQLS